MTTFRDDAEVHPPMDYPGYKSTALRHPKEPLIILPHRLTEVTAPVFGEDRLREYDHDLTRGPQGEATSGAQWAPPVDVYEDEGSFVLLAELPGLGRDDIELHLEARKLTLRGERKLDPALRRENFHQVERPLGRFARSFTLPQSIDHDKIGASFKDGVLTVVLPKADEVKPKVIRITSG